MSFFHGAMSFFHGLTCDRLNPTALCKRHEAIHAERPAGGAVGAVLLILAGGAL